MTENEFPRVKYDQWWLKIPGGLSEGKGYPNSISPPSSTQSSPRRTQLRNSGLLESPLATIKEENDEISPLSPPPSARLLSSLKSPLSPGCNGDHSYSAFFPGVVPSSPFHLSCIKEEEVPEVNYSSRIRGRRRARDNDGSSASCRGSRRQSNISIEDPRSAVRRSGVPGSAVQRFKEYNPPQNDKFPILPPPLDENQNEILDESSIRRILDKTNILIDSDLIDPHVFDSPIPATNDRKNYKRQKVFKKKNWMKTGYTTSKQNDGGAESNHEKMEDENAGKKDLYYIPRNPEFAGEKFRSVMSLRRATKNPKDKQSDRDLNKVQESVLNKIQDEAVPVPYNSIIQNKIKIKKNKKPKKSRNVVILAADTANTFDERVNYRPSANPGMNVSASPPIYTSPIPKLKISYSPHLADESVDIVIEKSVFVEHSCPY